MLMMVALIVLSNKVLQKYEVQYFLRQLTSSYIKHARKEEKMETKRGK